MYGRAEGRRAVAALLEQANAGHSGVLVVEGEPGMGKTLLCQYAIEQASGTFKVIQAQGVECEADIPFAGLQELVAPISTHLCELPDAQREALAAALALAPPVASEPFALGVAILSLLAAASNAQPLLAIVDDAHWLDPVSAQAIGFAGRRLGRESVGFILSQRVAEGHRFDANDFPRLLLGPLEPSAAAQLLCKVAGSEVAPAVAKGLVVATNGNPMALIEAARSLNSDVLAGQQPLPDPLPLDGSVRSAFERRLTELPELTRRALEVVAADDTGSLAIIAPALAQLGLETAALEPAETTDVVVLDDVRVRFRHPLVRAVAYYTTRAPDRRAAHRALAISAAMAGDHEREAWHRASAATGPDEDVAAALERSAQRVQLIGGATAAAGMLERAALLTPPGEARGSRLVAACGALVLAGRPASVAVHLDEALRQTTDPYVQADAARLRAQLASAAGEGQLAVRIITTEARAIAENDRARAGMMLAEASLPCLMDGRGAEALALAREACEFAKEAGGVVGMLAVNGLAHALLYNGEAAEADRLLLQAYEQWRARPPDTTLLVPSPASGLMCIERYDLARAVVNLTISEARASGAPAALPFQLATLSQIDFCTGDWLSAYASAAEASALAAETGQLHLLGFALMCLASVEAGQGLDVACRTHAREAVELHRNRRGGGRSLEIYYGSTLGLLELSRARYSEAARILSAAAHLCAECGFREPGTVRLGGDWVEANALAGDRAEAEYALESFAGDAQRTGRLWAKAAALRGRALLSSGDEAESLFLAALSLHEQTATPFEQARTQLSYGEWLLHHRDRSEAQRHLRPSLATFERLGAVPWSDRARSELRASGENASAPTMSWAEILTPRELQVALAVANGNTNKEAAGALFLSSRTVEFHLVGVYRKLGIRSRSQLTRLLARSGDYRPTGA